ncbi:hypothetical protein [Shewanella spartinae]|uniref:hypothetical protein n=1 Tax=Shewanella spartinae TaxID=2864205 RepID=UPI001C65FFC5|nr:hypothetical protein [Shewanella spartinae]QYJ93749.1 hypothetical protein K0I31_19630 [Shewanella spartinae]
MDATAEHPGMGVLRAKRVLAHEPTAGDRLPWRHGFQLLIKYRYLQRRISDSRFAEKKVIFGIYAITVHGGMGLNNVPV